MTTPNPAVELRAAAHSAPCRTTQHCAHHGWCRRCDPDFAAAMSLVNLAIQRTEPDQSQWRPLYEAVGKALRDGETPPVCIHPEGYEDECPCPPSCICCRVEAAADPSWTQLEARAFNAVQPALRAVGEWLPLSARRAIANAVLAAVREHLDIGEAEARCKTCRRVWDGPRHRCESDAERRLARVQQVIAERRREVAEREAGGMLEFGTSGASWCDAIAVTCDRIDDALKIFPPPAMIQCEPNPTVREAAADDRRWDADREGA